MKNKLNAEKIFRCLLTLTAVTLTVLLLSFFLQPQKVYEPVPMTIADVTISDPISPDGITQSFISKVDLKGICVRWATHKTIPENPIFAELLRAEDGEVIDSVELPAESVRDNIDTDIIFQNKHEPGEYIVRLTSLAESEDIVTVWESAIDSYKEGKAYNTKGKDEGRDWSFFILRAYPDSLIIRHRIASVVNCILAVLTGAFAIFWIYRENQLREQKWVKSVFSFAETHTDRILIGLLILIPLLTYMDFLTGERLYVFNMMDRGADSVGQTYPNLLNTAVRVRNGLWGELFNFKLGLGDAQAAFSPTLTNWVALFGEKNVARLMGLSQMLKVMLSGIFAYLFVKEFGGGKIARFITALGYCFNSMLIARSAWETYPNISLLMIFWLYAYERRLNGKKYFLFLFSTLFTFINLVLYDCVLYGLLLPGYMLIRRIIKEENAKAVFRAFLRDLGLFAVFALFGMLDVLRYQLIRALSSSRLAEGVESYQDTLITGILSGSGIWMQAFLRTIGHSINGILNHRGPLNLLEAPAFYTGILALLTAPVSLYFLKGKKKWVYLVLTLGAILYIAIVPLRLVINGFAKETFKLSSFWILILLLLLLEEFLLALEKNRLTKNAMIAAVTSASFIILLLLIAKARMYVDSNNEWLVSFAMVILYLILIVLRYMEHRVSLVRFLILWCVITEAILVPREMIRDRFMESPSENSWTERAATTEIIDSLPQDEWYRVEKDYTNIFLTDSLAEGFKGTSSYLGGIEINQSVLDIYSAYSLPHRGNHYLNGSGGNIYFESAAAVRYLLTKNDMEFRYGYEFMENRDGINVYENKYASPLITILSEMPSPDELRPSLDQFRVYKDYRMKNNIFYFNHLPKNRMLILVAEFDTEEFRGSFFMQDWKDQTSFIYFLGSPYTVMEIANDNLHMLWFDINTQRHLQNLTVYMVDQDTYYQALREQAEDAREHAVPFNILSENHFTGQAETEEDGYIITAIPYDKKWKVTLDGLEQDTFVVNHGFLGAKIPAGEHQLEILYAGDSWLKGNMFKLIGIGIFLFFEIVLQLIRVIGKERRN